MGVNGEDESQAKPQRQTPNLTNKHQPQECQFGTQMYIVFFFLHAQQTDLHNTLSNYSCVEPHYLLWYFG